MVFVLSILTLRYSYIAIPDVSSRSMASFVASLPRLDLFRNDQGDDHKHKLEQTPHMGVITALPKKRNLEKKMIEIKVNTNNKTIIAKGDAQNR